MQCSIPGREYRQEVPSVVKLTEPIDVLEFWAHACRARLSNDSLYLVRSNQTTKMTFRSLASDMIWTKDMFLARIKKINNRATQSTPEP